MPPVETRAMKGAARALPIALALGSAFATAAEAGHAPSAELARIEPALREGRYEDALRLCGIRLRRAPDAPAETILCARAEEALGRYPEARRRLEAAVA